MADSKEKDQKNKTESDNQKSNVPLEETSWIYVDTNPLVGRNK